jgi:mRNA interferase MazF
VTPVRGRVYWADLGYGRKPWLVVSNNRRNSRFEDCLVVRITTTAKPPDEPTVVRLTSEDQLAGWVLCDDVTSVYREELTDAGALTRATMEHVNDGLRAALAL